MKFNHNKIFLLFISLVLFLLTSCSATNYITRNKQLADSGQIQQAIDNYYELIAEDKDNADLYYQLALILSTCNRLDEGLKIVNQAVVISPLVAKYRKLTGKILLAQGEGSTAVNLLLSSLALDPDDVETSYLLARAYWKIDKANEALLHLNHSLALNSNHFDSHLLWVEIKIQAERDDQQISYLITRLEKALKIKPDSIEGNLLLFRLYQIRGDLHTAVQILLKWQQKNGWREEYAYELAMIRATQKRWVEVIKLLDSPQVKNLRTKTLLFRARYYSKKSDSTLAAYREILASKPDSLESLLNRAELEMDNGEVNKAERIYQKAIRSFSEEPRAYQGLAELRYSNGDLEGAITTIKKALALSPLNQTVQQRYLTFLAEYDLWGELETYFKTLPSRSDSTMYLFFKGLLLKHKQQYKKSNTLFIKALSLESATYIQLQLADLAIMEGNLASAEKILTELEQKIEQTPGFKLIKARLYLVRNNATASIKLLLPLIELKQKNGKIHLLLADAYLLQKELTKALQVLVQGLRIWPFHPALVEKYTLILGGLKRYGQAIEILEKMKKSPPRYQLLFRHRLFLYYLQAGATKLLEKQLLQYP